MNDNDKIGKKDKDIMDIDLRTPQVPSSVHWQKKQTKLHGLPQFFNHIIVLMSRKYVSLANEKCVLDQSEAFSHGCMVVIRFHFLLQSSEFYWPFGLFFCERKLNSFWSELVVSLSLLRRFIQTKYSNINLAICRVWQTKISLDPIWKFLARKLGASPPVTGVDSAQDTVVSEM